MSKWKIAKLGEVGRIVTGNTPSTLNNNYYNRDDIPFFKPNDINDNEITDLKNPTVYISEEARLKVRILPSQSVLVTCIGIIGKVGVSSIECTCNQQINAIIPHHEICNSRYIAYAIKSKKKHMENISNAPVVPIINKTQFSKIEISLPPLDVQRKIATTLDTVSDLLKLRKQQLSELDLLVKSIFIEMFGDLGINDLHWPSQKLSETCIDPGDVKCGPFGTQLSKSEFVDSGVALWGIPQINSAFTQQPTDFVTTKKAIQLDAYSIKPGDIAMSRKGNVGMCALFPDAYTAGIIHSDVLRIRADRRKFNPTFLMYQLHISPIVETQIDMVSSGAVMAGINVTKLKDILIHVPPLVLQNQFDSFVQQVDKLKYQVQKAIDETQTLFDSLMSEYFN